MQYGQESVPATGQPNGSAGHFSYLLCGCLYLKKSFWNFSVSVVCLQVCHLSTLIEMVISKAYFSYLVTSFPSHLFLLEHFHRNPSHVLYAQGLDGSQLPTASQRKWPDNYLTSYSFPCPLPILTQCLYFNRRIWKINGFEDLKEGKIKSYHQTQVVEFYAKDLSFWTGEPSSPNAFNHHPVNTIYS